MDKMFWESDLERKRSCYRSSDLWMRKSFARSFDQSFTFFNFSLTRFDLGIEMFHISFLTTQSYLNPRQSIWSDSIFQSSLVVWSSFFFNPASANIDTFCNYMKDISLFGYLQCKSRLQNVKSSNFSVTF